MRMTEPGMHRAMHWLAWLPVALFIALAASHWYLVNTRGLSPWLGGGFGMFSTTDAPSRRALRIEAIRADGSRHELRLPQHLVDEGRRVRALPSPGQAARLGAAIDAWLGKLDCDGDGSCRYAAYAFEVWRVGFDPETLLPAGQRIATFEIEARHGR